jgi:hypothetical protein
LPHPADVGPLAEAYLTKLAERGIVFQGHQHLASPGASVPIPKFASLCGTLVCGLLSRYTSRVAMEF